MEAIMDTKLPHDTVQMLQKYAPAVFGEPAANLSDRYVYVPTVRVLELLFKENFYISKASQAGNDDHSRHVIRMRKNDDGSWGHRIWKTEDIGTIIPEIVLSNSHNGKSTFQIYMGLFRLVCKNGMTALSGQTQKTTIKHLGSPEAVVDMIADTTETLPQVLNEVREFTQIQLSPEEQAAYAEAAIPLRWSPETHKAIPQPQALLTVRRKEDNKSDLWSTFSRIQENMTKGGVTFRNETRKRNTIRQITSAAEDLRLNKSLWALTQKMAEIKTS
jgi:hypothetical protein